MAPPRDLRRVRLWVSFGILGLGLALVSCGDDGTTDPDPADPCNAPLASLLPSPFEEKGGVIVESDCVEIASWNHEEDGASFGEILAPVGGTSATCALRFVDHDLARQAVTNRPGIRAVEVSCLDLDFEVADGGVASVEEIAAVPGTFRVHGLSAGRTTVRFLMARPGEAALRSGPIDVVVENPSTPPADLDFAIVLNGIRKLFVVDGALVPSCGSTTADPGFLEARVGEITDGHYSFRSLDASNCRAQTYDESTHHLAFEFEDPCIAGIVNHPEHYDVKMTFHLEGLAAGETRMRMRVFEGTEIVALTPWVPVVVTE